MKDEGSDKNFKVKDHRRFDAEGNVKDDAEERPEVETTEDIVKTTDEKVQKASDSEMKDMPPINFITFVLSLASSVQFHLGLIPNPTTGKLEVSLPMAKQTIDVLDMLQEKTKGNLDEHESRLIEQLLYELRLQYLEKKGK